MNIMKLANSALKEQSRNTHNNTAIIFSLLIFVFLLTTCNTTEPPPVIPPQPKPAGITLKLITKSSTEIFLTVSAKDTLLPATVTIERDNTEIMNFYLTKHDTTIIDTALAAGKTYSYKPMVKINGKEEAGDSLFVTTLDTTSSNFTWQTYTFGNFETGSSYLSDVAIINENDIWAVGVIYLKDSSGVVDPNAYNAVHWDGNEWMLKRIMFNTICGQSHKTPYPASSVFVFNNNEIWIAMDGDQIATVNNNLEQTSVMCLPFSFSIKKMWGSSSNDVYAVGDNGNIAHYNGTSWTKIESGTTTYLNDVWGINDSTSTKSLILSTVSSRYHLGDYKLLSISDNTAEEYFSWPYTRLYGIWFNSPEKIYIVGDGGYLYENNKLSRLVLPSNSFLTRVKGTGLNNVFIAGCCNTLLHFNGVHWQTIQGIYGNYEGLDVKGNTVVAVGWTSNKAIITLGKRN